MDWVLMSYLIMGILLALLFFGLWVSVALGVVGVAGLLIIDPSGTIIKGLGSVMFNTVASFELTAVPLFLLMGEIILGSGISSKFYLGASAWLKRIPGGLLQSNIVTCAFFAAISGSSVATAAAIGGVAYPEQIKRNYDTKMVLGSLAAGGTLGILIPPSVTMIVYCSIVSESVPRLFMAGVVPGLVATAIFMIYILIRVKINPTLAPHEMQSNTKKEMLVAFLNMCPFFLIIFVVLGGIYLGWTTPTEAAAVGVCMAVLISIIFRSYSFALIIDSLKKALMNTSMIIFIMVGAKFFTFLLVQSGINRAITNYALSLNLNQLTFLIFAIILYLILGCLMDAMSQMFLTLPLLLPIINSLGIDLIWYGVFLTVLLEIGHLTPPLGLNVFVLQSVSKRPVKEVLLSTLPYWGLLILVVVLLMIFPGLATWLPAKV